MGRWWRRRSLRARVTLASTAGLAVALFAVALLLRAELRASLSDGLDNTARQGAREVAALADAHRLPDPVPVAAGTITVQVLNTEGRIIDASPGADLLVPLLPADEAAANARAGRAVVLAGPPYGLPSQVRVVTVATRGGDTVIAAVASDQVGDSVAALTRALLIGTPLLLLVLAGAIWLVVGTTLRPIAELRRVHPAAEANVLRTAEILRAEHPDWGTNGVRFDVIVVDAAGAVRRIANAFRGE